MRNYINVSLKGNKLYHKYIEDGVRKKEEVNFTPSLYFKCDKSDPDYKGYKSLIHEYPVKEKVYQNNREFYNATNSLKDTKLDAYGNISPIYQFIAHEYPTDITFNFDDLRILYFDIETAYEATREPLSEHGIFEIITISAYDTLSGKYFVLGLKDETTSEGLSKFVDSSVEYILCEDETELLHIFLDLWKFNKYPDMVVGWNSDYFDIPHIYHRMSLLIPERLNELSPVGKHKFYKKTVKIRENFWKENWIADIKGINSVDMMNVYQKCDEMGMFKDKKPSYRLDYISDHHLGHKKLEYDFDNLMDLYRGDFDTFCKYNVIDVKLMIDINDKIKILHLAVTQSYEARVNFGDVGAPTRRLDTQLCKEALDDKIVAEPFLDHGDRPEGHGLYEREIMSYILTHDDEFDNFDGITSVDSSKEEKPGTGAFNLVPDFGLTPDGGSIDVNSQYPSLECALNMGPETMFIPRVYEPKPLLNILSTRYNGDMDKFLINECSRTANGVHFYKKKLSLYARQIIKKYNRRVGIKGKIKIKKKRKGDILNELKRRNIKTP